jgi:hypothetical protein
MITSTTKGRIRLLINRFPTTPSVWRQILAAAGARLSIGLHLDTANQGFDIVQFAADRNIEVGFDIYDSAMA